MITLNQSNIELVKTHDLIWNSFTNRVYYATCNFQKNDINRVLRVIPNTILHTCYPSARECSCDKGCNLLTNNKVWHLAESDEELTQLMLGMNMNANI